MFASHHKLLNLTAIIDYNKLQSLGSVSSTLGLEPLVDKLEAFGCAVSEIDGHNHHDIARSLVSREDNKPLVIIAHTTKGKGVSFMENQVEWHYRHPNDEQLKRALDELRLAYA